MDQIALPIATCDQSVLISRIDLDDEYSDSTLTRVRGFVSISMAAQATQLESHGAFGLIEVEGVDDPDAIPYCPFEHCDASWLHHQFWSIRADQVATSVLFYGLPLRFDVDAAAMRRLEAGDSSLWFAIENDVTSNQTVEYWWGFRLLLAEK